MLEKLEWNIIYIYYMDWLVDGNVEMFFCIFNFLFINMVNGYEGGCVYGFFVGLVGEMSLICVGFEFGNFGGSRYVISIMVSFDFFDFKFIVR